MVKSETAAMRPAGALALIFAALGCGSAANAEVVLHAFNWPYATVQARAAEI